ncbi:uncharacterized protein LOC103574323 [Microplitis demolitor]|uniref:uncharacterized protein LOC103574323 n=1 Tax=Microplitis demolitor TaxID=69319 RepID=UPI0004CCA526|nr:uncharacterized protein LOC103574323 [Microplitis demolitor]
MDKKIFYRSKKQKLKFPMKIFDGYEYNIYRIKNGISYIRCYDRDSKACYACGKIWNNRPQLSVEHNHESNPKLGLYYTFQEDLYNETIKRPYRSIRLIYDHLCLTNHEAAVEYTWVNMQPVMNNWRRLNRPLLPRKPQSLQDYAMLLSMPQYSHLTHYSQGQLSVSTESSADNSLVTVLYDLNFVMSVTTSTLFMDATFKITPKQPKVYQVFTILAQINNKVSLPVCWMLMCKKSAAAYIKGLEFFKTNVAPHIAPNIVMTDFESSLKIAIREIYPEAVHSGCFFHFCQALIKKLKKLGILGLISTWKYGQIIMRKFMGLALLPADDIVRGYQWLINNIPDGIKMILQPFLTYFYDEWIIRTPPTMWSVFNLLHRTNNVTESYNKKTTLRFGDHPTIWDFTEKLKNLQAVTRTEFESLNNGEEITRQRQSPEEVYHESKIKKMWDLYDSGALDLPNFLACASDVSNAFRSNHYIILADNADNNDDYEGLLIFLEIDVHDL